MENQKRPKPKTENIEDLKKENKTQKGEDEQFKEGSDSENLLSNSDDFDDINETVKDIDQPLLNILDRWFQSYLRIITFMGTASGVVLLYVGVNLIQVINDSELEKDNEKVSLFQSSGMNDTDSLPVIKKDTLSLKATKSSLYSIIKNNKSSIQIGIIFLTISLLSTILCVLATYNWYISGVSNILKSARSEEYLFRLIQDKLTYRNAGVTPSMWFWGQISLYSGWLTGISLGIGVFTYAYGVWEVIRELLHIK